MPMVIWILHKNLPAHQINGAGSVRLDGAGNAEIIRHDGQISAGTQFPDKGAGSGSAIDEECLAIDDQGGSLAPDAGSSQQLVKPSAA